MKNKEIRDLTTEELKEKITETSDSLSKITLNHAITPLENPLTIRITRKTVARLKTELKNRERAEKVK
jgi:large subunit ribosomal protein L29